MVGVRKMEGEGLGDQGLYSGNPGHTSFMTAQEWLGVDLQGGQYH